MSNEIATHNALQAYRGLVAETVKEAADMTIHELVDAFQRLTKDVEKGKTLREDDRPLYNEAALLAIRLRNVYASMANARFGISIADSEGGYDSSW